MARRTPQQILNEINPKPTGKRKEKGGKENKWQEEESDYPQSKPENKNHDEKLTASIVH